MTDQDKGKRKSARSKSTSEVTRSQEDSVQEEQVLVDITASCNLCKKNVPNDTAISCEICENWFHIGCVSISKKEYEFLNKYPRYHWWCDKCEQVSLPLMQNFKSLAKRQEALEDEVKQMKEKLEVVSQQKGDDVPLNVPEREKVITACVDNSVRESLERNKRKNNIVIKNVKEGDSEEDDLKALWEFLELENIVHEKPVRVGRNRGSGRPRLLRLELRNRAKKYDILKKAHKLGNSENEDLKNIFIAPDLTLMQRNEKKQIRDELKARRANGESNLAIRQGKIVVLPASNIREDRNKSGDGTNDGRTEEANENTQNTPAEDAGSLEN